MIVITTTIVAELRRRLRAGEKQVHVATALGMHVNTVRRYQNDWMTERFRRAEHARWLRKRYGND